MYNEYTEEEIINLYHKVASELSFFNAAEGGSWGEETIARQACSKVYKELCAEFSSRGLTKPIGNYLI